MVWAKLARARVLMLAAANRVLKRDMVMMFQKQKEAGVQGLARGLTGHEEAACKGNAAAR